MKYHSRSSVRLLTKLLQLLARNVITCFLPFYFAFLDLQSVFSRYVYFTKLFLKGKSDLMGRFVEGEFENFQDYSSVSFHTQSVKSLLVIETWI